MLVSTLTVLLDPALPWTTRLAIGALVFLACVGLLIVGLGLWPRGHRAEAAADDREPSYASRDDTPRHPAPIDLREPA